jgi:hypothetical protein
MPDINRPNVDVWRSRFRRLYSADLAALEALSDTLAAEAGELVTITSTQMEGSAGSGVITGNKLEMLAAVEELLQELSPTAPVVPARGIVMRFEPC